MKKIGIVGGIAWPSTVEYYSGICRLAEQDFSGTHIPEMVIESLDMNRAVACVGTGEDAASWLRFDEYHRAALRRLESSGAQCALLASNTAHHRFAEIVRDIGIPVIDLFEAVAAECARIGARQVLVLGTATTMRSIRLRETFAAHGVEAAGPEDQCDRDLAVRIGEELQHGRGEGAAACIHGIARRAGERRFAAPPVVCLACTELPLAFPGLRERASFTLYGITYVNTAATHIAAAYAFAAA